MLFIVSFKKGEPPAVARQIAHMVDGACEVSTRLPIHSRERSSPLDYASMVAFSFPAARTFGLPGLPVYIDDSYTVACFKDVYAVFKRDLTNNPWNFVRTLMPLPDKIINGEARPAVSLGWGVKYVDTTKKAALFDKEDVRCI